MSKDICPVCISEQDEFENHHVIWRYQGGTDDPVNILRVCNSCHGLITRGNKKDRIPRDMMCVAYKLAEHGLEFIRKSGASGDSPLGALLLEISNGVSEEDADRLLKHCGMEMYFTYHKIISGKIPHDDKWYEEGTKVTPINTLILGRIVPGLDQLQ